MNAETIAIVMGVVEALKRAGLKGRAAFGLAVGLAFVIFAGEQAAHTWPAFQPFFQVVLYGLYGVAATGWYDLLSQRQAPPPSPSPNPKGGGPTYNPLPHLKQSAWETARQERSAPPSGSPRPGVKR